MKMDDFGVALFQEIPTSLIDFEGWKVGRLEGWKVGTNRTIQYPIRFMLKRSSWISRDCRMFVAF